MKIERRNYPLKEIRTEEDGKITGYAAVFDKLSVPLWGFREKIDRGAFAKSIKRDDIRALWNHDPSYVLGRNKSGSLTLEEDDRGLKVEITPPEAQWAKDFTESIRRGDVDQMSFGFEVVIDEWDESKKDNTIRTLREVSLFDVSPVTFPAYPQTEVQARAEVFEEYNLDHEKLSGVLFRMQRGQVLESDHDIINDTIKTLKGLISDTKEEEGLRAGLSSSVRRNKLILMEKEIARSGKR